MLPTAKNYWLINASQQARNPLRINPVKILNRQKAGISSLVPTPLESGTTTIMRPYGWIRFVRLPTSWRQRPFESYAFDNAVH